MTATKSITELRAMWENIKEHRPAIAKAAIDHALDRPASAPPSDRWRRSPFDEPERSRSLTPERWAEWKGASPTTPYPSQQHSHFPLSMEHLQLPPQLQQHFQLPPPQLQHTQAPWHFSAPVLVPLSAAATFAPQPISTKEGSERWFSRRHRTEASHLAAVEKGRNGSNSVPNPAKTAANKRKKEKKELRAKEKDQPTRAELRAHKQPKQ